MTFVELNHVTKFPLDKLFELSVLDLESRVKQSVAAEDEMSSGPWELQFPSASDGSLITETHIIISPTFSYIAFISRRHICSFRVLNLENQDAPSEDKPKMEIISKLDTFPLIQKDSLQPEVQADQSTCAIAISILVSRDSNATMHSNNIFSINRNKSRFANANTTSTTDVSIHVAYVVGFESGAIRFYNTESKLLYEQMLHEEAIKNIRCFTTSHALRSNTNLKVSQIDLECLLVIYKTVIVCIPGYSVIEVFKYYTELNTDPQYSMPSPHSHQNKHPPTLDHRKWRLEGISEVNDAIRLGMIVPSLFDYLQDACILGGFDQKIRGGPTPEEQFIAGGVNPMLSFFILNEQGGVNVAEIVVEVASRVGSVFSSGLASAKDWFRPVGGVASINSNNKSKDANHSFERSGSHSGNSNKMEDIMRKPAKILRPQSLPMNSNISDPSRIIRSLSLAPRGKLAAAADEFGRILLVDTRHKVVVRILKGYREAQLGWIESREEIGGEMTPRHILFVVIYTPIRGVLEVWPCQAGERVAAFNVGKGVKLLHTNHGILGLGTSLQNISCTVSSPLATTYVLYSNGILKEIFVPFHLGLPPNQLDTAEDEVLLKRLKSSISQKKDIKSIEQLILSLDKPNMVVSGLYLILRTSQATPEEICGILNKLLDKHVKKISSHKDEESDETDRVKLPEIIKTYLFLTQDVYMTILLDSSGPPLETPNILPSFPEKTEECVDKSGIEDAKAPILTNNLISLFDTGKEQILQTLAMLQTYQKSAHFLEKKAPETMKLVSFLSSFHIKEDKAILKDGIDSEKIVRLGVFLFSSTPQSKILKLIEIGVSAASLKHVLLSYWLSGPAITSESIEIFYIALKTLNFDTPSKQSEWQQYRLQCAKSTMIGHALIAAITARLMTSSCQKDNEEAVDSWEPVTEDDKECGRLVDQLTSLNYVYSIMGDLQSWRITLTAREQCRSHRLYVAMKIAEYLQSKAFPPHYLTLINVDDPPLINKLKQHPSKDGTSFYQMLQAVRSLSTIYPVCLNIDIILVFYCIQCFIHCTRHRNSSSLKTAVESLKYIQSLPLRQCLAIYCWREYLAEVEEKIILNIERGGQCPSNKLLQKTFQIDICGAKTLIKQTKNLVEIIQKTLKKLQNNRDILKIEEQQTIFTSDPILEVCCYPSATCIIDNIMDQKLPSIAACEKLYLLLFCVQYIVELNMKLVKPLSLIYHLSLLEEFNLKLFFETKVFVNIQKEREQFIYKIVSHYSSKEYNHSLNYSTLEQLYAISEFLEIDLELTKGKLVITLYGCNKDDRAEEILMTIHSRDLLGPDLVNILGLRLGYVLFSSVSNVESIHMQSLLPPTVHTWVEKIWNNRIDSKFSYFNFNRKYKIEDVKRLCETIKSLLNRQSIAAELITNISASLEYYHVSS